MLTNVRDDTVAPKPSVPFSTSDVLQSPGVVGVAKLPPKPTNTPTSESVSTIASRILARRQIRVILNMAQLDLKVALDHQYAA